MEMDPAKIAQLTDDQLKQLDKALDTFDCLSIACDICPVRLTYNARIVVPGALEPNHVTACGRVYVAALALARRTLETLT